MRMTLVIFGLFFCIISKSQTTDTVSLYFDLDERKSFDHKAIEAYLEDHKNVKVIKIIGYSDQLGSESYNQMLSKDRATAVAAYLLSWPKMSINSSDIIGGGVLKSAEIDAIKGDSKNRRVDAILQPQMEPQATPIKQKPIMVTKEISPPIVPIYEDPALPVLEIDTTGETNIILEGVGFIPGRHYPTPESRPQLERLLLTMKTYPSLVIEVQGFICCDYTQFDGMDSDTETPNLSENRAKFIYDFLVREGIDEARVSYIGYGSSRPKVFPELTEEDKQANRRVELKVVR
jgi:outer membrane protein OmpA-like peptidoglycan-associated protein